ncbi:MAG: family 2 glycosyl transferase [Candidatus Peregrinibacteria bacterium Greene0416_62]|nr:MAG: family 2 glycosyl transferase [Candidatus Peregrinibacteria bacterium Greene0416_62]TSD00281.1 MAG: family 2 glycosyl transferase [Candidatus Peregrinibacteria bacterium Greene1014_49]
MGNPLLSVVIPTHERADILARCLHHLALQTIAKDLEVIVVSDGHDEATTQLFEKKDDWRLTIDNLRFLEIPKSQQGLARNIGVQEANAPTVLFIGDDIFLESHACEIHLKAHQSQIINRQSSIVLGYTTWDPAIGITPVMRWLEESGWQFGYPLLKNYEHKPIPSHMQHRFTYTSHISLPTEIATQYPFREDVTLYGWEDIEWGSRLRDAGIPLIFKPDARALHHHHITLESSLRRMEVLGESAVRMEKLLAGFDRLPKGWKCVAYEIAAMLPTMAGRHRRAFLSGIRSVQ